MGRKIRDNDHREGLTMTISTIALVLAALVCSLVSTVSAAVAQGTTILNTNREEVSIYRDEYGVPHIFARSRPALFTAYGYVVAQDRLWQLETNRRSARGRLAEILGPGSLPADRNARTLGYTDAELGQQFAALSKAQQDVFTAYVAGINRYIAEVVTPNPSTKLPFEFHFLGIGAPAPWTTLDAVAIAVFLARPFLEHGEGERDLQALLNNLIAMHGPIGGFGIFNDLQWINDPDAPTSVPTEGAFGKKQKALPYPAASQLTGASREPDTEVEKAYEVWRALGVPVDLGSHGWVVSAAKSTEGSAMLFGGPQLAFNAPAAMHEVQLKADDLNVTGMAFAGVPFVLIGRNNHIAWTTMDAFPNNVDIYVETVCSEGAGFLFNGACIPYQRRIETIPVFGQGPVSLTVEQSIHGPVVGTGTNVKFARKSVQRMREIESISAFMAFSDADGIAAFEAAIRRMVGGINVIYGDKVGNIAYWRAGEWPVRKAGFDLRLPLPGDGSAEWTGKLLPIPSSINPARGWLANWNNKADVNEEQGEIPRGKQDRVLDIEARLQGRVSLADMRDIAKDIARTVQGGAGRQIHLKPYLLSALDAVPSAHPLAAQARAVLAAWDGARYADAVTSTTIQPGQTIFAEWLRVMRENTFLDEVCGPNLPPCPNLARATGQVLLHVLDERLGGGSGVPPSRDYFNGADPNERISAAFTQALSNLCPGPTACPAAWSNRPRGVTQFRHAFSAIPEVGRMLEANKGTFAQIVVLRPPKLYSESIIPLGQSGFIQLVNGAPVLDPHFRDQFDLYKSFGYKPMRLYQNKQLQE
jgi:penicillin amidase